MKRGLLIAFEGLDGCGKSTQLKRVALALQRAGFTVECTHEPTNGPHGTRIREMARSGDRVPPEHELAWFMDDRREHVRDTLEPGVAAGKIILTDRYMLSSVAYQGARGLDPDEILRANEEEFLLPDLALIFEIDAAEGLERVAARGGVAEPAFEELGFLSEAARIFASLDRPYIERIDARPGPDEVEGVVMERLEARLGLGDSDES